MNRKTYAVDRRRRFHFEKWLQSMKNSRCTCTAAARNSARFNLLLWPFTLYIIQEVCIPEKAVGWIRSAFPFRRIIGNVPWCRRGFHLSARQHTDDISWHLTVSTVARFWNQSRSVASHSLLAQHATPPLKLPTNTVPTLD